MKLLWIPPSIALPLNVFLNEKDKRDFIEKATMLYRGSFSSEKKLEVLFFIQILGAQHPRMPHNSPRKVRPEY